MSAEQNKAIIRRWYEETFDKRNLAIADELVAADFTSTFMTPEMPRGPEGVKLLDQGLLNAAEDWRTTFHDVVAEDDRVAVHVSLHFTHTGELLGIAPTGKTATLTGFAIYRLRDGQVVEEQGVEDLLGLYRQLGVAPPQP